MIEFLTVLLGFAVGLVGWHAVLRGAGPISEWILAPLANRSQIVSGFTAAVVLVFLVFVTALLIRLIPWLLGAERPAVTLTTHAFLASLVGSLSPVAMRAIERVVRGLRDRR